MLSAGSSSARSRDTTRAGTPATVVWAGTSLSTTRGGADLGTLADAHVAEHLGADAEQHPAGDLRMPVAALLAVAAERHRLEDGDVVGHNRGLADHHARGVIDEHPGADPGRRMDVAAEHFRDPALDVQRQRRPACCQSQCPTRRLRGRRNPCRTGTGPDNADRSDRARGWRRGRAPRGRRSLDPPRRRRGRGRASTGGRGRRRRADGEAVGKSLGEAALVEDRRLDDARIERLLDQDGLGLGAQRSPDIRLGRAAARGPQRRLDGGEGSGHGSNGHGGDQWIRRNRSSR